MKKALEKEDCGICCCGDVGGGGEKKKEGKKNDKTGIHSFTEGKEKGKLGKKKVCVWRAIASHRPSAPSRQREERSWSLGVESFLPHMEQTPSLWAQP